MYQAARNKTRDYSQLVRQETFHEQVRQRALGEWLPVHFHVSTGSTGNPTPAAYTLYDLKHVIPQMVSLMIVPKQQQEGEPYFDWGERAMNIFPGAPHLAFFAPILAKTSIGTSSFD